MLKSKWCLVIGLLAVALFVTTAAARDADPRGSSQVESTGEAGVILNEGGAVAAEGDVVYGNVVSSLYYSRPFPGYRHFDDIHLQPGPHGDLVEYRVRTFGSTATGADAGLPYNVEAGLWTDVLGDPALGIPDQLIAGTQCNWVGLPVGATSILACTVPAGITIPNGLWMGLEFNQDNCGWRIASGIHCPTTGPPGYSEDFFAEEDLVLGGFAFYYFGACPGANNLQASFVATIITEGQPWACCDTATFDCTNIQESLCTGVYTQGTLCNNLPQPCSAAGACCDTATGSCRDTFEVLCDGYLEVFTVGSTCSTVSCPVPPNVPTLTQWGMIALTALLLTGLTIKFGRRHTVTA